jgi:hypothetical protein
MTNIEETKLQELEDMYSASSVSHQKLTPELEDKLTKLLIEKLDGLISNEVNITVQFASYDSSVIVYVWDKSGSYGLYFRNNTYKNQYEISYKLTELSSNTPLVWDYIAVLNLLTVAIKERNVLFDDITKYQNMHIESSDRLNNNRIAFNGYKIELNDAFESNMIGEIKKNINVGDVYVINKDSERRCEVVKITQKSVMILVNDGFMKRINKDAFCDLIFFNTTDRLRKIAISLADASMFKLK